MKDCNGITARSVNEVENDDDSIVVQAILNMSQAQNDILHRLDAVEAVQKMMLDEFRHVVAQTNERFIELLDKRQKEEIDRLMNMINILKISKVEDSHEAQQRQNSKPVPSNQNYNYGLSQEVLAKTASPHSFYALSTPGDNAQQPVVPQCLVNNVVEQQMQFVAHQRALASMYGTPPASFVTGAFNQSQIPIVSNGFCGNVPFAMHSAAVFPSAASIQFQQQQTTLQAPLVSTASIPVTPVAVNVTKSSPVSVPMSLPKATPVLPQQIPSQASFGVHPKSIPFTFRAESKQGIPATTPSATGTATSFLSKPTTTANPSSFTEIFGSPKNFPTTTTEKEEKESDSAPKTTSASVPEKYETGVDDEETPENFEPSAHFEPVIELPELVEVTTGEENEVIIFAERCRLFRFVVDEYKERGVGVLKILENPEKKISRIVMRRDQVHKVCANHIIQPTMTLMPLQKSDRAFVWLARDFAEEEKMEKFAARFKTVDIAKKFEAAFNAARSGASLSSNSLSKTVKTESELDETKKKEDTKVNQEGVSNCKGFGDAFKPSPGSWTCNGCYLSNTAAVTACVCCGETRDGGIVNSTTQTSIFSSKPMSTVAPIKGTSGITFGFRSDNSSTNVTTMSASNTGLPTFRFKPAVMNTATSVTSTTNAKTFSFVSRSPATTITTNSIFRSATTTTASAGNGIPNFSFKFTPSGTSTFGASSSLVDKPNPLATTTEALAKTTESTAAVSTKSSFFGGSAFSGGSLFGKPPSGGFAALAAKANAGASKESPEPAANKVVTTFGANKFDSPVNSVFSSGFKKSSTSEKTEKDNDGGGSDEAEEFEPNVHYEPVIPLPSLIEVKTGEEGEQVMFKGRSKLYRYVATIKEYKERGVGDIKILFNPETKRYRIVMRRDQVLKVCANTPITENSQIKKKPNTENACMWMCKDYSEEKEGVNECFVARFKDPALADDFIQAFRNAAERKFPSAKQEDAFAAGDSVVPKVVDLKKQEETKAMQMSLGMLQKGNKNDEKANRTPVSDICDEDSDEDDNDDDDYEEDEDCSESLTWNVTVSITEAYHSPLKPNKPLEFTGLLSLKLMSYGPLKIDLYNDDGEKKWSHFISVQDSLSQTKNKVKYIAVENTQSEQLVIEFANEVQCSKAYQELEEVTFFIYIFSDLISFTFLGFAYLVLLVLGFAYFKR
ncbi:unnamed protein product [Thelazia callipaeda]|uniref:RanBP2-type domain-containing protein n=1 Tax=Thelazia callipaeda TaxID=103827 RepID=A0A0N5D9K9_THECL|nr:unnamed protein product [Thelazia callipaeda]